VIADVRMPEMSGIELQSRLWDRGSSLPFFITVVSEESLRARTQELRNLLSDKAIRRSRSDQKPPHGRGATPPGRRDLAAS
jgi:DNA-binding NarL/FixJ family response regulator